MGILSLLGLRIDDASADPRHWSGTKLANEAERLQSWLDSATLSDQERAAIERVMSRISKAAAWRRKGRQQRFDPTTTV